MNTTKHYLNILLFVPILGVSTLSIGEELASKNQSKDHQIEIISEGYSTEEGELKARKSTNKIFNRHYIPNQNFDIFHIDTILYNDVDYNGFYTNFSIEFDLDVSFDSADVYAEIYIKHPHEDYQLLHTTEVFTIWDNARYDSYEVSTELRSNYPADYYDILIELYNIDDYEYYPVAVASAQQHDELYALPLESTNYQSGPAVIISHGGAGALTGLIPGLLLFIYIRRRKYKTN